MKQAEAFPLGVFVKEELEERGWSIEALCRGTAMAEHRVRELIDKPEATKLSMREAEWLGCALGVSAALLLNLQLLYTKWRAQHPNPQK